MVPLSWDHGIDGGGRPSITCAMLRIGRRTRIVGVLIVAISSLAAGVWAREWVASRDERQVRQPIACGRFAAAEAPLLRWLKARPGSAQAQLLKGRKVDVVTRLTVRWPSGAVSTSDLLKVDQTHKVEEPGGDRGNARASSQRAARAE
jgi:hypothetical protein